MSTPPMLSVQARAEPLRSLRLELDGYGLTTHLVPDVAAPFVVAALPGAYGDTILTETRDGRTRFVWREGAADHPGFDPAGAARRIATAARREQRDRRSAAEGGAR